MRALMIVSLWFAASGAFAGLPATVEDWTTAWVHDVKEDVMTGEVNRSATILSADSFELDPPYSGEQRFMLTVRNHPRHGVGVVVTILRGQIQCGPGRACNLMVRFDDDSPSRFRFAASSSGSSRAVLAVSADDLLERIASARVMRIEVPIYRSAPIVGTFNVDGLDMEQITAP